MSIASWTSPPASVFTFPISRVIRSESSAFDCSRICAKRKRMLPRSGAGTSRHSSHAARAAATARSTSSAPERGNDSITSPVDGLRDSKVAVAMPPIVDGRGEGLRFRIGLEERAGNAGPAAVARLALAGVIRALAAAPPVGALAPVDDDRDVRVVAGVGDHLLEEVRLELARNHAVDHGFSVGAGPEDARTVFYTRAMSGAIRPSSVMCAFHSVNEPSSSPGSWPRLSRRTGLSESGETRYWYHEMSHATVTTTSAFTPDNATTETRGLPSDLPIPPTVRRYWDALKRSAASTMASSCSERRRRIGSGAIVSDDWRGVVPSSVASKPRPRPRRRASGIVGEVGAPSRIQPYSTAVSAQSGQTST